MAVLSHSTIFDGEEPFRELGGGTYDSGHDHPEQRARTSRHDGGGHADDVAGSDGGGQRRTQSRETGDFSVAVIMLLVGQHVLDGENQPPHLQTPEPDGQIDTGCHDHDDQRNTPHQIVDGGQNLVDSVKHFQYFLS